MFNINIMFLEVIEILSLSNINMSVAVVCLFASTELYYMMLLQTAS